MTRAGNIVAIPAATGRDSETRASDTRRMTAAAEVYRARAGRRELKPREERFAHLKRMYD